MTRAPRSLKSALGIRLRGFGFRGSGAHFARATDKTINTVWLQSSKHGGSTFVNLGLHFTFLPPNWCDALPPNRTWQEPDCEFRWRLLNEETGQDCWGEGFDPEESVAQGESIAQIYAQVGEGAFRRFATPEAVAQAVSLQALLAGEELSVPWRTTPVRMALALSRIHKSLGNVKESASFAKWAISQLSGASSLAQELTVLANAA